MKALVGAILIVTILAVTVYMCLYIFDVEEAFRSSLSALTFGAVTPLHQMLKENYRKPRISTQPASILSFEKFVLPWYVMYIYVSFSMFGILQLSSIIATFLGLSTGLGLSGLLVIYAFSGTVVGVICSFMFGAWIGVRCASSRIIGVLVSLFAVSSPVVFDRILGYVVIPDVDYESLYGYRKSLPHLIKAIVYQGAFLGIVGVLGFWRGNMVRKRNYLHFVLKHLPEPTQDIVLELVYQEALIHTNNGNDNRQRDST